MVTQGNKTILLVEDDMAVSMAEADSIKKFGYNVITVHNGENAVQAVTAGMSNVDLVLMDIDLGSGMDGIEAARRILKKKNVPIVFLAAYADRENVERVEGITPYGYVIKESGNFVLQSSIELAFELFEAHQRISESEARQRTLVQTIPDLVWLKDADGVYLACNPRFEDFFGARESDIVGKTDYDFLSQEHADFFRDHDRKAVEAGKPTINEEWITFASDGRRVLLETIKTPMTGKDGRLIGVLGISRDITERKRVEDAFRENQRMLATLISNLPGMVYRCRNDPAWTMDFISDGCISLTGYTPEELIGSKKISFGEIIHPEDRAMVWDTVQAAVQAKRFYQMEYRIVMSDGFEKYVWEHGQGIYSGPGDLIALEGFIMDITERKRAEEAMRSSERRLKEIIDGSPIPQYVIDREHHITHWNRALEEYSGIRSEDVIGTNQHWRAFYPCERPCMTDLLVDGLTSRMPQWYAGKYSHSKLLRDAFEGVDFFPAMRGGTWLYFTAAPIYGQYGAVIGAVETLNDITEQKQAEAALEKRIMALTRPLDDTSGIKIEELFDLRDIQRLQDEFARATGVASIITHPDGTPITEPSNFCRLCNDVIRGNDRGLANCYRSDSELGRISTQGPSIRLCASAGLWDAGAGISAGGRHIASWLIGQVRDETQSEDKIRAYAEEIGVDASEAVAAFREVSVMSQERFQQVAQVLYTLANQLSAIAYQNIQQARFIAESRNAEESLRRSESDYRSVIENIQDVFYRSDDQGRLIMASPSFTNILGYDSLDECLGRLIAETFYYYPEKRIEFIKRLQETGSVVNYEVVLKTREGQPVFVETSSHFFYSKTGEVAGVEGIFRDITLRRQAEVKLKKMNEDLTAANMKLAIANKDLISANLELQQTEEALRINESRLKRAQEIAHVGNWEYNIQTNQFWGSEEAKRIYGFDIGQPTFSVHDVEQRIPERERVHQALVDLIESGREYNLEFEIFPKDSSRPRIITSIAEMQPDEHGDQVKVVGVIQDITERKRAEEALRSSERRMKEIIDGSPIPQFVIDRDHRITHWNRALEEYSGIRSEDVIGTNQQWRAFYPYERPCMADLLVDGVTNIISQWYEGKYSHSKLIRDAFEAIDFFPAMRGGTWLYFTAAPIYGPDGAVIGAVETLSDVTDRMRAEDALKLNNLRLDTLLKVNQMTDRPIEEIMKYVFEEAVRLTKSEIGYLGRMNDDETVMDVMAWSRNVMPECHTGEKTLMFPIASAGLWAEAVRQRRPIVTNDYEAPNPWKRGCPAGHIPIKRHMNVPIMDGSKIALIAGVGNKAEDYDATDVRQLTLLMEGMLRIIERKHAEDSLRNSLAEKDVILRELYHRTKNNMQVICGMLNLRAAEIKDPVMGEIYRDIQNKIRTMALVHQKLYDSKDLSNINLNEYVGGVVDLMLSNNEISPGRVTIHQSVDAIPISIDTAMPLGLVLNELISNTIKHAFPDKQTGEIWVDMHPDNNGIVFEYRDSGIGLHRDFNPANSPTLGMSIIRNLSRMQLGGDMEFVPGKGFRSRLSVRTNLYPRRL